VGPRAAATLADVDDDFSSDSDDPEDELWSSSVRGSTASSSRDASTPTTLFASPHTSQVSARAVAARIQRRLGEGAAAAPAEDAAAAGGAGGAQSGPLEPREPFACELGKSFQ